MKYTINTRLFRTDSHSTTARYYSATVSSQDPDISTPDVPQTFPPLESLSLLKRRTNLLMLAM